MPFYEYVCSDCGHAFEELVRSMSAKTKIACPSCGGKKTTQQLSVFAAKSTDNAPAGGAAPSCGSCSDGSCPYAGG